jgi:ferrous iron transport protein B
MAEDILRIAMAGNPNCGKTTLFNALTGAHHKVGNYPGVTVEKLEGVRVRNGRRYHFVDLPGIYSLTAYSLDEVVARDFILNEKPDIIVDVLDSTNLERNLYLCLQFQELGIPVVGALNMSDEAEAKGIKIDDKNLSRTLGIPMVKTIGPKGAGTEELLDQVDSLFAAGKTANKEEFPLSRSLDYRDEVEQRLAVVEKLIASDEAFTAKYPVRWMAVKLLEKDSHAYERLAKHSRREEVKAAADEGIAWLEKHFGKDSEIIMAEQRYGYIRGAVKESVQLKKIPDFSVTEAIDRVIMNRFLSLPIFVAVLWGVFQLTFFLGQYPMEGLELFFGWLSGIFNRILPAGLLRSLVVDGIIGGVGGVFSFVPLIIILFFLLSILEDLGYMSRAAFATDKFLHAFGLHGQSIFPMMLGFGCSVPAIMAARTLKSRRDRVITVLITPFMSCGAKLPVHVLLAAAFFPEHSANMVMLLYACGVVLSLAAAFLLRKTVLRGDPTPFVMELPPYRSPTLSGVLWHVWEKSWMYVKRAGTVIFTAAILIWAITSFPVLPESSPGEPAPDTAAALEYSFAGRLGRVIEPVFKPLGFNWRFATASVVGFAAKELAVSTLGILYRAGEDSGDGEENAGLRSALAADPDMTPLIAFVFMLFTLIIPPCFAALGTMKSELGWKWVGFEICFLLTLGWLLCFLVYHAGLLAGL